MTVGRRWLLAAGSENHGSTPTLSGVPASGAMTAKLPVSS